MKPHLRPIDVCDDSWAAVLPDPDNLPERIVEYYCKEKPSLPTMMESNMLLTQSPSRNKLLVVIMSGSGAVNGSIHAVDWCLTWWPIFRSTTGDTYKDVPIGSVIPFGIFKMDNAEAKPKYFPYTQSDSLVQCCELGIVNANEDDETSLGHRFDVIHLGGGRFLPVNPLLTQTSLNFIVRSRTTDISVPVPRTAPISMMDAPWSF